MTNMTPAEVDALLGPEASAVEPCMFLNQADTDLPY